MASVEEFLKAQRSHGPATVLAIGTANPSNCISQADFPDYYFRITKSEHMTELKKKFQRMCMFRNKLDPYSYIPACHHLSRIW